MGGWIFLSVFLLVAVVLVLRPWLGWLPGILRGIGRGLTGGLRALAAVVALVLLGIFLVVFRGAQEAIVTISGYVGVIIAAIVGLSLAGFSFTNLAIIAGALSVGIGFGMQNIVNNFISGIILLFERPIRTGDWIVVGAIEGTVETVGFREGQHVRKGQVLARVGTDLFEAALAEVQVADHHRAAQILDREEPTGPTFAELLDQIGGEDAERDAQVVAAAMRGQISRFQVDGNAAIGKLKLTVG